MSSDTARPLNAQAFAEAVIALARQFEQTQAKQREDTTTEARMLAAGQARREWKRVEATLPDLIVEAHREQGWPVDQVATILDVSESYVYRILRSRPQK